MATESFYQDMVIDTPEAARNLEKLFESGIRWKRGDTEYEWGDEDFFRVIEKRYNINQ